MLADRPSQTIPSRSKIDTESGIVALISTICCADSNLWSHSDTPRRWIPMLLPNPRRHRRCRLLIDGRVTIMFMEETPWRSLARIPVVHSDPNALRTMLRDAFGFRHVDAGEGWLIFALPPADSCASAEDPTYTPVCAISSRSCATTFTRPYSRSSIEGRQREGRTTRRGLRHHRHARPAGRGRGNAVRATSRNGTRRRLALSHLS